MSDGKVYKVLFVGYANTTRSLMAEAILERWSAGRFVALSAGAVPADAMHPQTAEQLRAYNHKLDALTPKSWDQFAGSDGEAVDFIFTVSERVRELPHPNWSGHPMLAHWGTYDPELTTGDPPHIARGYRRAYLDLEARIKIFTSLRVEGLDRLGLEERLSAIGRATAPESV